MESENREGLVCPECGSVVGEDDINIRADLAHCRACGLDFSYAGGRFLQACETWIAKPPSEHFEVEWKKQADGSVGLYLAYRKNRSGTYGLLMFFVAFLVVNICETLIQDGRVEFLPVVIVCVPLVGLLLLVNIRFRSMEIAMADGKVRVWVYSLFRGKGRAFDYNEKTRFRSRIEIFKTWPYVEQALTAIIFRNGTAKPFVVKYNLSKVEDGAYLSTALTYALPRYRREVLKPCPGSSPEARVEAEMRRIVESLAAKVRKQVKWMWVKLLALFAVMAAVLFVVRVVVESREKTAQERRHLDQVVRTFAQGGDYRAVARSLPKHVTTDYYVSLMSVLADFDAVAALYRDCSKAEGLDVKTADAILAKCVAITNVVSRGAKGSVQDCIQARCKALIEACQSAKSFLEKSPDPQNRVKLKISVETKVSEKLQKSNQ